MAIKLKNMSRHWLVKALAILLILVSGQYLIWSTYQHVTKNPDLDFQLDYEDSRSYYSDLDSLYKAVFEAYYSPAGQKTPAVLAPPPVKAGYFYVVAKSNGDYFSNIKGLSNESEFYQIIASMERIERDSSPLWRQGQSYFNQIPPFRDYVLIGMDAAQLAAENESYQKTWAEVHSPWLIRSGLCLLIILIGMGYLAWVSGRKPNSDTMYFTALDAIFLDVYFVFWLAIEALQIAFMDSVNLRFDTDFSIIVLIIFATVFGMLGLLYWTMVSKRIKAKQLFRHTLIGWVLGRTFGLGLKYLSTFFRSLKDGPFYLLPIMLALGFMVINVATILLGFILSVSFGMMGFLIGSMIYLMGLGTLAAYLIYQDQQLERVLTGLESIENGNLTVSLSTRGTKQFARLATRINHIANGFKEAVEKELKAERMKAELITNVSHDLKTPLTSIISYVDLLKTQGLDSPDAAHYLDVLDQKSQRLKQLTDDLFEASKASSGNLQVSAAALNLQKFILQATGEFMERFESCQLTLLTELPEEPIILMADGRHLWRVLENLLLNIWKYAAPHSRVYLSASAEGDMAHIILKNISAAPLNISSSELLERFTRGDLSRNTEGSGLGLSIAKSLTELQNGNFELMTDGDLFKVTLKLPLDSSVNARVTIAANEEAIELQ